MIPSGLTDRLLFMRLRVLPFGLFMLATLAATPASAQRSSGRDRAGADRADLETEVRSVERAQRNRASRWAAARGLPLRVRQPDGRTAELMDVIDGRPLYTTSTNRYAGQVLGTATLHPGGAEGLGLSGAGLSLGIWDAGRARWTHQEFGGRVRTGDNADVDQHATHVAGTLIAGGIRPEARGMAFEADLLSYDWSNDGEELFKEGGDGLLVSNHSYGPVAGWHFGDLEGTGTEQWYWNGDPNVSRTEDYVFGWYGTDAAQFDRVVYANPDLLPVVAAGNERTDGGPTAGPYRGLDASGSWVTYNAATRPAPADGSYDTIAGAAVAKNVLTVGSVRVLDSGAAQLSAFSSFGPTDDGRLKPDVVGHGEGVFSAFDDSDTAYGYLSGTSMATPNVAGSLLLLQQHTRNLTGDPLPAATLKALTIHTATDLDRPGPDYRTGWGLVNAQAAAAHLTAGLANPLAVGSRVLTEGETLALTGTLDTRGPLRVTLAWTDEPGTRRPVNGPSTLDDPTALLRADLDLRLVHLPTGTEYQPFVLDPDRPEAIATPGDNVRDPVEQIFMPDAPPGAYAVYVTHKRALPAGEQAFGLIIGGLRSEAQPAAVARLEGEPLANAVDLRWEAVFVRSPGRFVIERAPVDYRGDVRTVAAAEVVGALVAGADTSRAPYAWQDEGVLAGRYLYRVVFEDAAARIVLAEVEVNLPPPDGFAVVSNYPNPFAERTTLVVDLPERQPVTIEVFDALGRQRATLLDETLAPGRHEFSLDASGWPPGLYLARVQTPSGARAHRLILTR